MPRASRLTPEPADAPRKAYHHQYHHPYQQLQQQQPPQQPWQPPHPGSRRPGAGALFGLAALLLTGWLLSAFNRGAVLVSAKTLTGFGSPPCDCRPQNPQHPQMAFCASDFVLKVRILRQIVHTDNSSKEKDEQYWVAVQNVYRNSLRITGLKAGRRIPLWIYNFEENCGKVTVRQPNANIISTKLNETHSYLVTGKFDRGKLFLSVCSWIAYWPKKRERRLLSPSEHQASVVSKEQSRYLRGGHYARDCGRCQIEDSSLSQMRNATKSRRSCRFDSATDYNLCLAMHAYCGHYKNTYGRYSECEWQTINVKRYKQCFGQNLMVEARKMEIID